MQTLLNASFAALSAAIPDQVPVDRHGAAQGCFGLFAGTGARGDRMAALGLFSGYACPPFVVLAAVPYMLLRRHDMLRHQKRALVPSRGHTMWL